MRLNNIPVLYIAFARPEYARQSFDAIKAAKPKTLYFYSNKGREGHGDEIERNNKVRAMLGEIDWDCDVHTWFRDECVDVYTSIHGAIDWLFDNEEMGIIIEEDCVASPAFFDFAEKMLLKYKENKRISMVGGSSYVDSYKDNYDYHFSHYSMIHGWGTWRDRWKSIDWENARFEEIITSNVIDSVLQTKEERKTHNLRIKSLGNFVKKTNCWDIIFFYTFLSRDCLAIISKEHLVMNVGVQGAHAKGKKGSVVYKKVSYAKSEYEITNEPPFVATDVEFDYALNHLVFYVGIKKRLKQAFKALSYIIQK